MRHVGILVGSQVMLNVGVSQVIPVLPVFAQEMGLGATELGLLISTPSLMRLALNLPLGRACDTVGRLPLMRAGTLVTAAGAVGTGLMMPYGLWAVLPFRLLIGAGSAASMTGSGAMMADLTDRAPRHRAMMMGLQSMTLSAVWVVGPVLGGMLAEAYGAQQSFYIAGAGVCLCSAGYSLLPETLKLAPSAPATPPASASASSASSSASSASSATSASSTSSAATTAGDSSGDGFWAAFERYARSPNVQALSALSVSTSLGQACSMTVFTLHARQMWEAGAQDLGLMFSTIGLCYVVGMPLGGWLGSRFSRKAVVVPGLALSNLALLSLAAAETPQGFAALLCCAHISAACVGPSIGAFTAEVLPPNARGQAGSVIRTSGDIVGLAAPIALGLVADQAGATAAMVGCATATSGCAALFAIRAREVPLVKPG